MPVFVDRPFCKESTDTAEFIAFVMDFPSLADLNHAAGHMLPPSQAHL